MDSPAGPVIEAYASEMPRRSQALTARFTGPPLLGRLVGDTDGSHTIGFSSNGGFPRTSTSPMNSIVVPDVPSIATTSIW